MKFTVEYKKEAYRKATTCNVVTLTNEELLAADEYAKDLKFYAEMSDDYKVTQREKAVIKAAMQKAYAEMKCRGMF